MNEIIIVNKDKDCTSRDVINKLCKIFNTKKIGHTGTLDPLATGVLVVCKNKALKVSELLMSSTKEYIAEATLGIETDTLDTMGKVTNQKEVTNITKNDIVKVLNSFTGTITQQVPLYSAIKIKGKKLYEYARNNVEVTPPTKEVEIVNIELLNYSENKFTFKCTVSKGTYIRSLIRDIGYALNNYATMSNLIRTKQGIFSLENANTIEDIKANNYKSLSILEALPDIERKVVSGKILSQIKNGIPINNLFEKDSCFILDENSNLIALYKRENNTCKPWKMFEIT